MLKKMLIMPVATATEKAKRKTCARAGGYNKGSVQGRVSQRTMIIFG